VEQASDSPGAAIANNRSLPRFFHAPHWSIRFAATDWFSLIRVFDDVFGVRVPLQGA